MSAFSDAVLALSPSSYWRFEGASPLADSGSGGITLTGVGAPLRAPSLIPCESGAADNAYDLDGSAMYFTAGDNYDFASVNFSIAMWLKVESATFASDFQRLMSKRETSGSLTGWDLYGSTGGAVHWEWDEGAANDLSAAAGVGLDQNETHFIVITWTDSTNAMSFYSDGTFIGTDSAWTGITPWATNTTATLTIGAQGNGGRKFGGVIDDVAIWSGTALSAANVTTLWDAANETPASGGASFYQLLGIG